jgi:hypothetical protein
MIGFEWDPGKAKENRLKHGVTFAEAATVLRNHLSITVFDPDHSQEEDRFVTIGMSARHRLLMVAHTDRGDRIRVISTRELTRTERDAYENETKRRNA